MQEKQTFYTIGQLTWKSGQPDRGQTNEAKFQYKIQFNWEINVVSNNSRQIQGMLKKLFIFILSRDYLKSK